MISLKITSTDSCSGLMKIKMQINHLTIWVLIIKVTRILTSETVFTGLLTKINALSFMEMKSKLIKVTQYKLKDYIGC